MRVPTPSDQPADPAHERIAKLINDVVQMQSRCSYVDFADIRTLFRNEGSPDATKVWTVGIGEARCDQLALATRRALRDLSDQMRKLGDRSD